MPGQPKGKPLTEKQKAALAKGRIKKGEVRNPRGVNGITRAREQVGQILAKAAPELARVLRDLAKEGDVQALKLALGHALPAQPQEIRHEGGVTFGWLGEEKPQHPKPNGKDTDESHLSEVPH